MPSQHSLLIAGAGGHAKVVIDAIRACGDGQSLIVRDDNTALRGTLLSGLPVECPVVVGEMRHRPFHVAVGNNRVRQKLTLDLLRIDMHPTNVVHPRACCARDTEVGDGSFLAAGAIVGPAARLGAGAIINHGAVVDHDCTIGPWVHVGPGAVLGGNVSVDEGVLVGAGAVILPGVRIGAWATVGAGAVVTKDVAPGHCVVGIPARTTS